MLTLYPLKHGSHDGFADLSSGLPDGSQWHRQQARVRNIVYADQARMFGNAHFGCVKYMHHLPRDAILEEDKRVE
jgi:hypothetical protein